MEGHGSGGRGGDGCDTDQEEPQRSPLNQPGNIIAEKEQVVKSFFDLITSGIDNHFLRTPTGKERNILLEPIVNPGFYFGAAAGIVQFAFLRKAPVYMMRRMQSQQGLKPNFQEGPVMKPLGTLFDAALSVATAGAVWALMLDERKVYDAAANIPLLEGRSQIADALCDNFITQHEKIRKGFWEEHGDDSLLSLMRFIENCRKRKAHENSIRLEQGLGRDDPVSIPQGGVSMNNMDQMEAVFDWASLEGLNEEEKRLQDESESD